MKAIYIDAADLAKLLSRVPAAERSKWEIRVDAETGKVQLRMKARRAKKTS